MKLYVIAGRPCSGKTTLTARLSNVFNIEAMYLEVFCHEKTVSAKPDNEIMYKWKDFNLVKALDQEPNILFLEYLKYYDELFPMLLNHLKTLDKKSLVIEGAIILPKYIGELKKHFEVNYLYLELADEIVDLKYRLRNYAIDLAKTKEGEIALERLIKRDVLFAKYIKDECQKGNHKLISITSESEFERLFEVVKKDWF